MVTVSALEIKTYRHRQLASVTVLMTLPMEPSCRPR